MSETSLIQLHYRPAISQASHGGWSAVCRELKMTASGETEEEARRRLRAIIASYCSAMQRAGLLEQAIKESGLRRTDLPKEPEEDIVSISSAASPSRSSDE